MAAIEAINPTTDDNQASEISPDPVGPNATTAREALMDDVLKGMDDAPAEEEAKAAPDLQDIEPSEKPDRGTESIEEDAEPAAEPEEAATDDSSDDSAVEAPTDPELDKRLEAIQRQERRSLERIEAATRKNSEVAPQMKELEAKAAEADRLREILNRGKYDPNAIFDELNLGDDELEPWARSAYARSPKGREDPRLRQTAAEQMRSRQHSTELSETRAELKELKEQFSQAQQAREIEKHTNEYLDNIQKAIEPKTPIVSAMMAKNPASTRARLGQIAMEVMGETGEVPEPADVVAKLESFRRTELEDLGIDPSLVGKSSTTEDKEPEAVEKKSATISNDLGTPKKPRTEPVSREEQEKDILRAIMEGRHLD